MFSCSCCVLVVIYFSISVDSVILPHLLLHHFYASLRATVAVHCSCFAELVVGVPSMFCAFWMCSLLQYLVIKCFMLQYVPGWLYNVLVWSEAKLLNKNLHLHAGSNVLNYALYWELHCYACVIFWFRLHVCDNLRPANRLLGLDHHCIVCCTASVTLSMETLLWIPFSSAVTLFKAADITFNGPQALASGFVVARLPCILMYLSSLTNSYQKRVV